MNEDLIYLDNAATTRTDLRVADTLCGYLMQHYGNPESAHAAGDVPRQAIHAAEQSVHHLLHTNGSGKVIFTSGGTESNNMVFKLCRDPLPLATTIITSPTEHKSVLEPARASERAVMRMLYPGKKGYVDESQVVPDEVTDFTLISLMHMNNETGMVNDVYHIGDKLKKFSDYDIYFHVDCVQSAGELPIYVHDMGVDMISVSGHKIYGPKGVGCLWISDRLLNRLDDNHHALSLILGGGQQDGFRAGTMDAPSVAGFGKACEIVYDTESHRNAINALAGLFIENLMCECGKRKIQAHVNFSAPGVHDSKILSIQFPGADAETVVMVASRNGLCISNGAACNSILSEPSYVLTNSGISPDAARNTVRISFSKDNTIEEMQAAAEILATSVDEVLALNLTAIAT